MERGPDATQQSASAESNEAELRGCRLTIQRTTEVKKERIVISGSSKKSDFENLEPLRGHGSDPLYSGLPGACLYTYLEHPAWHRLCEGYYT